MRPCWGLSEEDEPEPTMTPVSARAEDMRFLEDNLPGRVFALVRWDAMTDGEVSESAWDLAGLISYRLTLE
jgi:hypothetical protein